MATNPEYFRTPFAVSGDKDDIPNTSVDGEINYTDGYGPDYDLNRGTDPSARPIERSKFNELMYKQTLAIQQYQQHGAPNWITSDDNGGTPFPYAENAYILYTDGNVYRSRITSNTHTPTDATYWAIQPEAGSGQTAIQFQNNGSNIGTPGAEAVVNFSSGLSASESGGSITVTSTGSGSAPTFTVLTGGSGSYTPPVGCTRLVVEIVGGGAGGGGSNSGAGAASGGGTTSFGSFQALGGSPGSNGNTSSLPGAGGAGGNGGSGSALLRFPGNGGFTGPGNVSSPGGAGYFGGGGNAGIDLAGAPGGANTGAGGGAGSTGSGSGGGGGAGEYAMIVIDSPSGSYSYTVGPGGSGGTSSRNGGPGGSGLIKITEYY